MKKVRLLIRIISFILILQSSFVSLATDSERIAKEKLAEKLVQKEIYALVYMTESYEVKENPCKNSVTIAELKSADTVRILDVSLDLETKEEEPEIWFLVEFYLGQELTEGYIQEEYLVSSDELLKEWKKEAAEIFQTDEIVGMEADKQKDVDMFPTSYRTSLKKIKEKHPNWVFVPMKVNKSWNSCVSEQIGDYSWIYYNQPEEFRGTKINSSWYFASKKGIAYYMDPRNFLNENDIFMFEQNTYNESYHSVSALQKFLNNTFMKGSIPGDNKGRSYAEVIFNSGKTRGLSPFNLAARVIQEQGVNGNSQMISGTYPGYEGYYNYYNINASGSSNTEVYKNGLSYAKEKGWNTRVKALNGGAEFIGNGYILKGQDTLYLQKFDLEKRSGYLHQYMQNIMAPYTEGRSMRTMYQNAGSLNSDFVFKIPVFSDIPNANPLIGISFAETEAELYFIQDGVEKIPVLDENSKTVEIKTDALRKEMELEVIYNPADTSDDQTVIWKVGDENILSLEPASGTHSKAKIIPKKGGSTTVTAKVGSLKAKIKINVVAPMTEAKLEETKVTLYQGQSTKLFLNYSPIETTDCTDVEWWCSNQIPEKSEMEEVVKIENGSICAVSPGTATVHAKIGGFDGTQADLTCRLTVESYKVVFKDEKDKIISQAEGGLGEQLSALKELVWEQKKNGFVFLGWYSEKNGRGEEITPETVLNGNITAYPYFEETSDDIFVKPIGNKQYTGAKIKPEVSVYDKDGNLLVKDKDYRVSYERNLNVSVNTNEKPEITVTGLGIYEKEKKISFEILPGNLEESRVSIPDLLLTYNQKIQKAIPLVKDEYRTLQKDKDFILEYPKNESDAYVAPGVYPVKIIGIGNYTGERTAYITITKKKLITKQELKPLKSVNYNGGSPCYTEIKLFDGDKRLLENTDYTVTYFDHMKIGTAGIVITGIGAYTGSRTENFEITGTDLAKCTIAGICDLEYTGEALEQNSYILTDSLGNVLKENTDYTVSYIDNIKAGTGKMKLTGTGKYAGELMISFSVLPYDITKENSLVEISEITEEFTYKQTGITPVPVVTFQGEKLKKDRDYTLEYKNHKYIGEGKPTVIVSGKGNFKGRIEKEFVIKQQELAQIEITAKSMEFQNKKSFCFAEPLLKEKNSGRFLQKGRDYSKEYLYEYASDTDLLNGEKRYAGEPVSKSDIPLQGTVIKVTVTGMGNYKGTVSCKYRILPGKTDTASVQEKEAKITQTKATEPENAKEISGTEQKDSLILQDLSKTEKRLETGSRNEEEKQIWEETDLGVETVETAVIFNEKEIAEEKSAESNIEEEHLHQSQEEVSETVEETEKIQIYSGKNEAERLWNFSKETKQEYVKENHNLFVILKIIGCVMAVLCVMIIKRIKKKEDTPFGKKV